MAVEIVRENCTRKMDSLGRISVPKGIRDRLEIGVNEEMEFLTMGNYICMRKVARDNKYTKLVKMMKDLNLEVPQEVYDRMAEAEDGIKEKSAQEKNIEID